MPAVLSAINSFISSAAGRISNGTITKGGDDRTGPYDVVEQFWKPAPDHDSIWTWGSVSGVAVDNPNRIIVAVWGDQERNGTRERPGSTNYVMAVDRNGNIHIPHVGTVTVGGLRYQDLNGFLKTAIGRVFRNFHLNVNLGQLRSVQIYVVGQANRPGTYTVSSLSTLVNALFAAGGPSPKGSMRRVQLKRGSQVVTEFDLYDLLLKGDKSKDAKLLPGDVIYTGTPSGVGVARNPPVFLKAGDVVTLGIDGLGTQRQRIVLS